MQGSLGLDVLAVAVDACLTVYESLDPKDPTREQYFIAGKRIADLVEQSLPAMESGPTKPKLEIVKGGKK